MEELSDGIESRYTIANCYIAAERRTAYVYNKIEVHCNAAYAVPLSSSSHQAGLLLFLYSFRGSVRSTLLVSTRTTYVRLPKSGMPQHGHVNKVDNIRKSNYFCAGILLKNCIPSHFILPPSMSDEMKESSLYGCTSTGFFDAPYAADPSLPST